MKKAVLSMFVAAVAPSALSAQEAVPQPGLTIGSDAPTTQAAADAETLGYARDAAARMILRVNVSGSGPYNFIVDTAAERTSISRELAGSLSLATSGTATVHSMTEASRVETFLVPQLQFGSREMSGLRAPAFQRHHLGADGMLGADALQSQRVLFDFGRGEISISPSRVRHEAWPSDSIVVTARRRLGRLILVDAMVEGHRVWVVVDTGSEVTIANEPLQRLLARNIRGRDFHNILLHSVTGGRMMARYTRAREVRIGGAIIRELPIAFAEAQPFRQLDLMDRPAILLGMDSLRLFERVSVDFGNRRVRLLLRQGATAEGQQSLMRGTYRSR